MRTDGALQALHGPHTTAPTTTLEASGTTHEILDAMLKANGTIHQRT